MSVTGRYEKPFSLKILDSNYDVVTLVNYASVQWDREFNTIGQFTIDGVVGDYNKTTWKYVYSDKRKELGIISQVNWKKQDNQQTLTLSGYFAESELNKMVCYAKPTKFDDDSGVHEGTSILRSGSPTWVTSEGSADAVARTFFNGFKQISFRNYLVGDFDGTGGKVTKTFTLPISMGTTESGTYHYSIHNRNNEYLGDKLYDILKESGASIEIEFDYVNKTKALNIIHGVDRTQTGYAQGVNPVLLSSRNGSIKSASILVSNTDTKDAVIQTQEDDEQTLVLANALSDSIGRFEYQDMSSQQSQFSTGVTVNNIFYEIDDKAHKLAVMSDASTTLHEKEDVINIQFDFAKSSYRYMEDFDLGDFVSIEIPEIDVSVDAQIVSCHEAIENGAWTLTMEIGESIKVRKRGNY